MAGAILATVALAVCGCGVGFGAGEQEGMAELAITRDYGEEVLMEEAVGPLDESSTAMRLLDRSAQIETSYGGGFVDSIESISSASGARSFDWFYFVNGISAETGAAEFLVQPGDRMWWDYRDWTSAMDINAVVGSFPAPMKGGYDGVEWPVFIDCLSVRPACEKVEERLDDAGVKVEAGQMHGQALRVLVGSWGEVSRDEFARSLEAGPAVSGVFADFVRRKGELRLLGLDQTGSPVRDFGPDAGLIAAIGRPQEPPVWLVTGANDSGVRSAADALSSGELLNRYAAATSPDGVFSLPVGAKQ